MPQPSRYVWYDHMTRDANAATSFYTNVVGWGTQPWDGPMPYTMFTVDDAPIGGVMQMPSEAGGAPPHWIGYIGVDDIEAKAKEVKKHGGTIHREPTDIPGVGRFAIAADPQGAVFALFSSSNDQGMYQGPPRNGDMSWHELVTTDRDGAWNFYHGLFGWEKGDAMDMGPAGTYQLFNVNGIPAGGMFNKTPDMPMPPSWLYYATVPDINAAADRVKGAGGQVVNGPMEVPGGGWILQGMDPQGGMFALYQMGAQA
jgi:predicted enzyme related to lactoylglutathione lyase